jgi:hypothetical protein
MAAGGCQIGEAGSGQWAAGSKSTPDYQQLDIALGENSGLVGLLYLLSAARCPLPAFHYVSAASTMLIVLLIR